MTRYALLLAVTALAFAQKRIATTIDDLPYVDLSERPNLSRAQAATRSILDALTKAKAPAAAFVNESKLQVRGERDARVALLEQWLDAGHVLGNHTFSHPDFNKVTLDEYTADIVKGEVLTRDLMRARGHERFYFRHPFTHTGPDLAKREGLARFLDSHGYTVAPFTVEHADYLFNQVREKLLSRGDTAQAERVRKAYVAHLDTMLDYFEKLTHASFGRDIAQILIIHASDLNAASLGEMLARTRERGYAFVTLDDALRDPAYRTEDRYVNKWGPSWLHRWAPALGRDMDLRNEPDPPQWVLDLAK
ncbi:MAG: polysaccharide deacetylase family protein [Bryobacteraceae bacterium]